MSEFREQESSGHTALVQDIFAEFGPPEVIGLFVTYFGKELTANALDRLGISGAVSGATLISIYANNRNNFKENYHE